MSTKTEEPEPINLKHRITGAAVLIFFGALVLPWVLGPPSEAKKDEAAEVVKVAERHSTFEDQVLAELEGAQVPFEEPEETVYVSKITPVNGKQVVSEPSELTQKPSSSSDSTKTPSTNDVESVAKVKAEPTKETAVKPVLQTKNASAKPVETKDTSSSVAKTPVKPTPNTSEKSPSISEAEVKNIDVGWVVQVELLTDKKGAQRLVKRLSEKGFEAHTTIVDTNRGKNTGTRIWLGPFEQRSQAAAENDRLRAKMGKSGFIRVYP